MKRPDKSSKLHVDVTLYCISTPLLSSNVNISGVELSLIILLFNEMKYDIRSLISRGNCYSCNVSVLSLTGGPLCDGDIEDADGILQVFCPWHDYDFNLRTGHSGTGLQVSLPTNVDKPINQPTLLQTQSAMQFN